jgi:hypothetical protein
VEAALPAPAVARHRRRPRHRRRSGRHRYRRPGRPGRPHPVTTFAPPPAHPAKAGAARGAFSRGHRSTSRAPGKA